MNDPVRELRHDIRGRLNAMKLCVAALGTPMERSEAVEFLGDVEQLCDTVTELLDALDNVQPEQESTR
jgi:hypothetical protein